MNINFVLSLLLSTACLSFVESHQVKSLERLVLTESVANDLATAAPAPAPAAATASPGIVLFESTEHENTDMHMDLDDHIQRQLNMLRKGALLVVEKSDKAKRSFWPFKAEKILQVHGSEHNDEECTTKGWNKQVEEPIECVHDPKEDTYTSFECNADIWVRTVYASGYGGCEGPTVEECMGKMGQCSSCNGKYMMLTVCDMVHMDEKSTGLSVNIPTSLLASLLLVSLFL